MGKKVSKKIKAIACPNTFCGTDSKSLAFELLDKGVAITPESSFGDYKEYFRLVLTMLDDDIKECLEIIAEEFF